MIRRDLLGCPVDAVTAEALVARLAAAVEAGAPHHHVSLNAAKWVAMRRDPELRRIVRAADTVAADGAAIVRAARLPERIPGIELADRLLREGARRGWRIALLGAEPEVVAAVAAARSGVVFAEPGYFDDEPALAARLAAARPQLVLLALGTPKAERFADRWRPRLPVVLGVGGAFDVWAGRVRRAPGPVGRAGLEWAWRFAGAPRARFRRAILDSLAFARSVGRGERLPDP